MQRIVTTKEHYYKTKPTLADFEKYNAHILSSQLVRYYFINNNEVQSVTAIDINELLIKHKIPTVRTALCNYFDSLPDYFWEILIQNFKIKHSPNLNRSAQFKDGLFSYHIPKKHHFESHQAHIMITTLSTLHCINENEEIKNIYVNDLEPLAVQHKIPTINQSLSSHFDSLTEESWQLIKQRLKIKQ